LKDKAIRNNELPFFILSILVSAEPPGSIAQAAPGNEGEPVFMDVAETMAQAKNAP